MALSLDTRIPASARARAFVTLVPATFVLMFSTVGALAAQLPSTFPKNFVCTPGSTQSVSQTVSNGDSVNILPGAVHITVATGGTVSFQVTGMPQFGGMTFAGKLVINAPIDLSSQVKGPAGGDLVGSTYSSAGKSFTFTMSCLKGGGAPPPPPPPPPRGATADDLLAQVVLTTRDTIEQNSFAILNLMLDSLQQEMKCPAGPKHTKLTGEQLIILVERYKKELDQDKEYEMDVIKEEEKENRNIEHLRLTYDMWLNEFRDFFHHAPASVNEAANLILPPNFEKDEDYRSSLINALRSTARALIETEKEKKRITQKVEGAHTAVYHQTSALKDFQSQLDAIEQESDCPLPPPEKFLSPEERKALEEQNNLPVMYAEQETAIGGTLLEIFAPVVSGSGPASIGTTQFSKRWGGLAYADPSRGEAGVSRIASRWGVWTSGALNGVDLSGSADSSAFGGRADVGIDYRVSATTLIGAFLGYEGEHLKADFTGGTVDENAFVFGAYTGVRLPQDWVLAIAGGGALNRIASTIGSDSGSTDGLRGFASASLSRTWRFGPWSLSPTGSIAYASEHQNGYITAAGVVVPAQTVELGRASLGPTLAYHVPTSDPRWQVELLSNVALKYDFGTDIALGTTTRFSPDGFGGSIGGGLSVSHGGMSGSLSASYDSIGRPGESAWTLHAGLLVRH